MGFTQLQQKTGFVLYTPTTCQDSTQYRAMVDKNGIIQVIPRREKKRSFKARYVVLVLVGLAGLAKGVILAQLEPDDYETRISALKQGATLERAAGWMMQSDPVTDWLVQQMRGGQA